MKKLVIIIFGLFLTTLALAKELNYDQMLITPQTWEEVDLTYTNTINGKKYIEQANLLRPIVWIKHNHLDKVGTTIHLTREQPGINTDVKVIAIKPAQINYSNHNHEHNKPVIATFITHNNDTWNYSFKNSVGDEEVIQAVPSHPFYSITQQDFLPIGQFKTGEQVKANNGSYLTLVTKYKHNTKVELTYNFEVYQSHNYEIGKYGVLVHNPGDDKLKVTLQKYYPYLVKNKIIREQNGIQIIRLPYSKIDRLAYSKYEKPVRVKSKVAGRTTKQIKTYINKRLVSLGFKEVDKRRVMFERELIKKISIADYTDRILPYITTEPGKEFKDLYAKLMAEYEKPIGLPDEWPREQGIPDLPDLPQWVIDLEEQTQPRPAKMPRYDTCTQAP